MPRTTDLPLRLFFLGCLVAASARADPATRAFPDAVPKAPSVVPASSGGTGGTPPWVPSSPGSTPGFPLTPADIPVTTVPIELRVPTAVGVELCALAAGGHECMPVGGCTGACTARVVPGRYVVYVHASAGVVAGHQTIDLRGPSQIAVDPDGPAQRWGGLALGVGGVLGFFTGLVLLDPKFNPGCSPSQTPEEGCGSNHSDETRRAGGILAVASLVAIPIGAVLFGKSFTPSVDVAPIHSAKLSTPSLAIVASAGSERAVFGVSGVF